MSFKNISYLELWQVLCSAEQNHLCNFGRRHHEILFCEIILNLDQWFRRKCHLKVFLIWISGSPLFSGVEPYVQFWWKVNYFETGPVVQEEIFVV